MLWSRCIVKYERCGGLTAGYVSEMRLLIVKYYYYYYYAAGPVEPASWHAVPQITRWYRGKPYP